MGGGGNITIIYKVNANSSIDPMWNITRASGVNEIKIDWGDGNTETTSSTTISHSYTTVTKDTEFTVTIYGSLTYLCFLENTYIIFVDVRNNGNFIKIKFDEIFASYDLNVFGGKYLYHIWFRTTYFESISLNECSALEYCKINDFKATSIDISDALKITTFVYDRTSLKNIRCVNVSSAVYMGFNDSFSRLFESTGTLTTDNSSASATLRATAEAKGWTVVIE